MYSLGIRLKTCLKIMEAEQFYLVTNKINAGRCTTEFMEEFVPEVWGEETGIVMSHKAKQILKDKAKDKAKDNAIRPKFEIKLKPEMTEAEVDRQVDKALKQVRAKLKKSIMAQLDELDR